MANAELLKKRKSNLPPPPVDEISDNIHPRQPVDSASYERIDARSFRRTGRTIQFNIRVTPAFDMQVREIAQRERRTLAEVLEQAMALYGQNT